MKFSRISRLAAPRSGSPPPSVPRGYCNYLVIFMPPARIGTVLAAIAGALRGARLAAWTAAATTVAAAFASHIAATLHQWIATSYATTADQFNRLIPGVGSAAADADRRSSSPTWNASWPRRKEAGRACSVPAAAS
jgi:hypothetical protein